MTLVERIKNLCKERGITVKQLEESAGLASRTIGRWDTSTPSVDKVQKVAEYLDVSIDFLLYGEDEELNELRELANDTDVMELREELRRRPETKILFHASKNAPASAILEAAALIERYKEESKYK